MEEFEDLRKKGEVSKSLIFEKSVPDLALTEFEFISPLEHSDLKRLYEDRNLCAHPSMRSLEETFPASAELARYHLRNAVVHLLQHPPVQGRAALETIWEIVESELFPSDVEKAINELRNSPLLRARKPLIRGFVIGLTKSLLLKELPEPEKARVFAALQAGLQIHFAESEDVLRTELSKIVEGVSAQNWSKVISYLRHIKCWAYLSDVLQARAITFIEKISNGAAVPILLDALNVDELRSLALEQVKRLAPELLVQNLQNFQAILPTEEILPVVKDYIQVTVDLFITSNLSGVSANGEKLLQVAPLLNINQMEEVLKAFCENEQIYSCIGSPEILKDLLQNTNHLTHSVKASWSKVRTVLDKPQFNKAVVIPELKALIELQLPNLLEASNSGEQEGET